MELPEITGNFAYMDVAYMDAYGKNVTTITVNGNTVKAA